jgi:hypothetical protein
MNAAKRQNPILFTEGPMLFSMPELCGLNLAK